MAVAQIDMALCLAVWDKNYSDNPEYLAAVASIQKGRDPRAVNLDLQERLNFLRQESARSSEALFISSFRSGW